MKRVAGVLALVPVLALAACGSSSKSDKDKITDLIKDVGKNPATLCTKYATAELLTQVGGASQCVALSKKPTSRDPNVKINKISITAGDARAEVTGTDGHQVIGFVKVGTDWKVSTVSGTN